jgi:hypothetical protein
VQATIGVLLDEDQLLGSSKAGTGNNFLGLGYGVNRRRIIPGELTLAVGGSGGAGGGDAAIRCTINDPNFFNMVLWDLWNRRRENPRTQISLPCVEERFR